jgi:hypothetical protein
VGRVDGESAFMDYRLAAGYDNGTSILPANGYFAEVVDRFFRNMPSIVILLKKFNQKSYA